MRIEMENVLYICITGFHTFETEGMGPQKFGKLLSLFQRERERELIKFFALHLLPLYENWKTGDLLLYIMRRPADFVFLPSSRN